jgi:ankyrin repeat protein
MNEDMSVFKEKLHSLGFDYNINSFKKAITEDNKSAIGFFIEGNILRKLKSPQSVLLHCLKADNFLVLDIIIDKMKLSLFSGAILFSLMIKAYEAEEGIQSLSSIISHKKDIAKTGQMETWNATKKKLASDREKCRNLILRIIPKTDNVNYRKEVNGTIDGWHWNEILTPLRIAVMMKDIEIISSLLQNGADTNMLYRRNEENSGNILHILCSDENNKNVEIAKLLIRHGVNINEKNGKNFTPLATAAIVGGNRQLELVKLLVQNGAELNERIGNDDSTALIKSIFCGNYEIADYLIDAGADLSLSSKSGWTAGRMAFARKEKSLGEKILKAGLRMRPFIGVMGIPSDSGGITVTQLDNTASGSASEAGVKNGDTIIYVNNVPVNTIEELIKELCKYRLLDSIPFVIKREGKLLTMDVILKAI